MIKNKKDNKILKRVLSLCLVLMLVVTSVHLFFPVGAETIDHTHIWATKYDSTNHWEYCTVCGEKRNVTAHTFTDHWYTYTYACGGKASTRTCDCGYSYTYVPHHVQNNTIYSSTHNVKVHFKTCKNCGSWVWNEECRNEKGKLSCKNPGKCSVCGGIWSENRHFINQTGGICVDCGQRIFTIVDTQKVYSSDYKSVDISFTVKPVNDEVKITGSTMFNEGNANIASCARSIVQNSDGTATIKWHCIFSEVKPTAVSYVTWRYDNLTVSGQACYVCQSIAQVWLDHTAPVTSEIKQTDQKFYNGYATIKQLDISGTEDYANSVKISILDKATGKKLVDGAVTAVVDNKWSYTCVPPLEADDNGRTYVVQTEDVNHNISSKEFTIYKTDGTAPQVESPLSYTDWSNKAKTITLTFTDYGSGDVQASLGDQTHYQVCTKTADGKYQITYTFSDDIIGNKNYDLYLKDGLGNATKVILIVGNIDKNTYTITYNMDGGTASGLKTTYTVEDTFTLPQPTKTGYTFLGYVGSNGTTAQKSVTVNKCTRGNLTYTAQWQANKYNVTLDPNGGMVSSADADGTVKLDMEFGTARFWAIDFLKFTKPGYLLEGIYDSKTGGNKVYDSGPYAVSGTYWNGKLWNYAGDKAIYCRWKPITYIIKFDANGGTGTTPDIVNTYGIKNPMPKLNFTRPGWKLTGLTYSRERNGVTEWMYGNEDGTWKDPEQWYELGKNPEGTKLYEEKNLTSARDIGCTYINNDVITGHAQWQINTYDLSVKHTVSGNMGNKHSDFSFTLNLSGMSGNNITAVFTDASGKQTTKILSMNNSKVAFSLKHGENVVFKSIPYNTSYTITENNADGYTVSNSNASGKVTTNTTVTFTSTRNATVPTSADTNAKAMVVIAGLSIIAMILILKCRKTNTK